ncbi:MAG: hypothetical protein MUF50_01680 [Planctomycetes bacterium]|jgi:hypothetical protein|nr:hypothetical protein [Planctomycetota bacterium]
MKKIQIITVILCASLLFSCKQETKNPIPVDKNEWVVELKNPITPQKQQIEELFLPSETFQTFEANKLSQVTYQLIDGKTIKVANTIKTKNDLPGDADRYCLTAQFLCWPIKNDNWNYNGTYGVKDPSNYLYVICYQGTYLALTFTNNKMFCKKIDYKE